MEHRSWFLVGATTEAAAGLALVFAPSAAAQFLLGETLDPAGATVGRLCGVALLSLAAAWWPARGERVPHRATGLMVSMLLYNAAAAALLVAAGMQFAHVGPGLWLAAGLHATITVWGVATLRGSKRH